MTKECIICGTPVLIETNSEIVTCNSDHCIRVTEENIGLQYQAGAAIPVSNGIIQEHFGYIMPVTRPVIEGFYHFVNQIDQARKNKINLN